MQLWMPMKVTLQNIENYRSTVTKAKECPMKWCVYFLGQSVYILATLVSVIIY